MAKIEAVALKLFEPENWGQVTRFQELHRGTYRLDAAAERALAGVAWHHERCMHLTEAAKKLERNLEIGNRQPRGRRRALVIFSEEMAAVIEAAIFELYAATSCATRVLRAVREGSPKGLKRLAGLFSGGGRKTFGDLPETLGALLEDAGWYEEFRLIRHQLFHEEVGSAEFDEKTGATAYVHLEVMTDDGEMLIEDACAWLEELRGKVNGLLGAVFHHLNETLEDRPVKVKCGIYEGGFLERWVSPGDELTFDSGMCESWKQFEKPGNPTCPFKASCGAYRNKAPEGKAD